MSQGLDHLTIGWPLRYFHRPILTANRVRGSKNLEICVIVCTNCDPLLDLINSTCCKILNPEKHLMYFLSEDGSTAYRN